MRLEPIERVNLGISGGAIAMSAFVASPQFALSLGLGAAFGALNFRALLSASRHMFAGQLAGSGPWLALFGFRFVALAFAIGLALRAGADAAALVCGLSMIIPATLIGAWQMRPPVIPDAPALAADDPDWERWDAWLARERDEQHETEA